MGGAEESDEGGAAFCRGAAFLQLVAGGNHLFHQYAGSGGACHTYLLRQYYYVRLSVQHLYGTGRSDMYRASDREKKPHAAFLMGKYVMKKSVMITVILSGILALFGHTIFWLADVQSEIIRMGATVLMIDVVLEIGRPINIFATNALRAAGDVNYPFYVGLVVMWAWLWGLAICSEFRLAGAFVACGLLSCWTKTSGGYLCPPLVQHEMGEQKFH